MSLSFLVVIFDKEIENSLTINSIINSNYNFRGCNLLVWNNGPNRLYDKNISKLENKGINVDIIENIENVALSYVYNSFIKKYNTDSYVLLDDDSNLNDDFFFSLNISTKNNILFPLISSNGIVYGPKINKRIVNVDCKLKENDKIMAIGSGITIGSSVCDELIRTYGDVFDERFFLYGVDTTFCYRINKSINCDNIKIIKGFEHSLSRLNSKQSTFRLKERAYDEALRTKYYSNWPNIVVLKVLIYHLYRIIRFKNKIISIKEFITAFLNGKHYRAR